MTIAAPETSTVALSSRTGRWMLAACVVGSGLAGIDATVVNIALPDIGRSLHAPFATLQWTVTAYTLTLASLILLGGVLGDRYGRRRLFVVGVLWFAAASLGCALAPTTGWLIAARAVQGVGGALLIPASLAIIQSSFRDEDRARAIGAWSGLSGTAAAVAPFVGGWLLSAAGWRWVFLVNPPLAVVVAFLAVRHVPDTRDRDAHGRLDIAGACACVVGLGGLTAGAIAASSHRLVRAAVLEPLLVGVAGLVALVIVERHGRNPMLPVALFRSRLFRATNMVTFLLYAANSVAVLLLVVALETVCGYSPLVAGCSLLPITVIMLVSAERFGALAQRIGPRVPLTAGPLISAVGLALMTRIGPHVSYVGSVLPAVVVFGLGLAVFVAPLTATALASVPATHAGAASGVNNAVARAAGLISIAVVPVLVGLSGADYETASRLLAPFRAALWICVALHLAGGIVAAVTIRGQAIGTTGAAAQSDCLADASSPLATVR